MRRRPTPDERKARNRSIHIDRNRRTHRDTTRRHRQDPRPVRPTSVRVEQIRRRVDLRIEMVGRTGTAQATTSTEDGGVGHEQRDAVIGPGDSNGIHLREGTRRRIPHLGYHDRRVVGEGHGEALAADNEDLAVGQHDAVVESAGEGHAACWHDTDCCARSADGNDMGISSRGTLFVARSATESQDLTRHSIKHNGIPIHRVIVAGAQTRRLLTAAASGVVPIHCFGGASLEDPAIFPAEKPAVVVLAVDALRVGREHRRDRTAGEEGPGVCGGIVDFAVFAAVAAAPGTADDERLAVREGGGGLVATRDRHIWAGRPGIGAGVVDAGSRSVVAAGHDGAAACVEGEAGTEHVVLGIGHCALGHGPACWIEGCGLGNTTRSSTKGVW